MLISKIFGVFGPETKVQTPSPGKGSFAAKTTASNWDKFWSTPAFALATLSVITTSIVSEKEQPPLEEVHINWYVPAVVNPLTAESSLKGLAKFTIAGVVPTCVHLPEPVIILFPFIITSEEAHKNWFTPASGSVGGTPLYVIVIMSSFDAQVPFVTFHLKE